MAKRGVFEIVLIVVIGIAVLHTVVHLLFYGTGLAGFGERGVSGLAVQKLSDNPDEISPVKGLTASKVFVFTEWIFVVFMFFLVSAKKQSVIKKEAEALKVQIRFDGSNAKTDIDRLYELLKEKKRLGISAIAKAFDVDKEVVLEWGETLELGELAYVNYPRIGEPEIVVSEEKAK